MRFYLLANTFHTPGILLSLIRNIKRQQQFITETLGPELEAAKKNSDNTLDETDFKKITKYYGLAVPAILGEALCVLRGYPMTLQERLACTYQGASTGLFDDFFDKHDMPDERLKDFIKTPEKLVGKNSSEKLFLHFYRKSFSYIGSDIWLLYRYFNIMPGIIQLRIGRQFGWCIACS